MPFALERSPSLTEEARDGVSLVLARRARHGCGAGRADRDHEDIARNVWDADEAQAFLAAAKDDGPQMAAFAALALDSGARKGELLGLRWSDLDLEKGTVTFVRQLTKPGKTPVFGP
jgi:integrase